VRWQQQAGLEKETGLTLCGDVKATDLYSVGRPAKRSKEINIQRHDSWVQKTIQIGKKKIRNKIRPWRELVMHVVEQAEQDLVKKTNWWGKRFFFLFKNEYGKI